MLSDVEWALAHGLDADELVPMLEKLVQNAEPGTQARVFGARHLAELLVSKQPWRAALLAREVLRDREDDRAWAVLGLAHTLIGNYRAAAAAYRRALILAPDCPWYLHNLGHLVDVALDQPDSALPLLESAHRREPREVEIATSYAHALARAGQIELATEVVMKSLRAPADAATRMIDDWLESDPPGAKRPSRSD